MTRCPWSLGFRGRSGSGFKNLAVGEVYRVCSMSRRCRVGRGSVLIYIDSVRRSGLFSVLPRLGEGFGGMFDGSR